MNDKESARAGTPAQPMFPGNCAKVDVSSDAMFDQPSAIRVGTAGNIVVYPAGSPSTAVTITAMAVGEYVGCSVVGVDSTGTTVTDVTRYWV